MATVLAVIKKVDSAVIRATDDIKTTLNLIHPFLYPYPVSFVRLSLIGSGIQAAA